MRKPRTKKANPFAAVPIWGWAAIGGGVLVAVTIGVLAVSHLVRVGGAVGRSAQMEVENRRTIAEIEQTADAFEQQQMLALFSDAPPGAMGAQYDDYLRRIESKAARLKGTEGQIARAAIAIMRAIQPDVTAYTKALVQMETSGGADPSVINSTTDIDRIKKAVVELRAASVKLSATLQTLPERFTRALEAEQVPPDVILDAERQMRNGLAIDISMQMQAAEVKVCDISVKVLDLLKREWGRWEFYPAENAIAFESAAAEKRFFELMDELDKAAAATMFMQP